MENSAETERSLAGDGANRQSREDSALQDTA